MGSPNRNGRQSQGRNAIGSTLLAVILLAALPSVAATTWTVRAEPGKLVNGSPVLFQVKPPAKLDSLTGSWLGHQFPFTYDAATKFWFVLAGVSFDTKPGIYTLELTGQSSSGAALTWKRTFPVAAGVYPKIKVELAVEKKFTAPSPEQQAQIAEGVKIKDDYLNRVSPDHKWDGNFVAPVDAENSDVFGSQRIFNGVAQRPHLGLDYRVRTGTPVAAMNRGTVLLARFLYYEGNFIVIDHGQGLLTLYFHLSEFKVNEGEQVERGEIIGLSGATGRATGPHLHVGVRWLGGISVNPAILLHMPLPTLEQPQH